MVKHVKKAKIAAPALSPSPVFDPVAYEAESPGNHAARAGRADTFEYSHRALPTRKAPAKKRKRRPKVEVASAPPRPPAPRPASPQISPTPSPVAPETYAHTQAWAQPTNQSIPPMYQPPSMGFLHHLPRHMAPFHETDFFTTPNGLVTYKAFTGSDAVVFVSMSAPLEHLLALYEDLSDRARRGG